jgi:hypothetical protein
MAEQTTVRAQEIVGDPDTANGRLIVTKAALGGAQPDHTLSAVVVQSGVEGLSFLVLTEDPNNNHQVAIEEVVGDPDTDHLELEVPKEMLPAQGVDTEAFVLQRTAGRVLVVPIEA